LFRIAGASQLADQRLLACGAQKISEQRFLRPNDRDRSRRPKGELIAEIIARRGSKPTYRMQRSSSSSCSFSWSFSGARLRVALPPCPRRLAEKQALGRRDDEMLVVVAAHRARAHHRHAAGNSRPFAWWMVILATRSSGEAHVPLLRGKRPSSSVAFKVIRGKRGERHGHPWRARVSPSSNISRRKVVGCRRGDAGHRELEAERRAR
jgi:hypothetical protein